MKRHLLSAADLTREDAELVLRTAEEMRSLADRPIKKLPALRGRTVVNLFFEDSTRTRISFEAAAKRLCHGCPVRPQCAAHALEVGEEYGVWGGFSENDHNLLCAVGWRDAVDRTRRADVSKLDRRLSAAREKAVQSAPAPRAPRSGSRR